jgi:hypothetical protein
MPEGNNHRGSHGKHEASQKKVKGRYRLPTVRARNYRREDDRRRIRIRDSWRNNLPEVPHVAQCISHNRDCVFLVHHVDWQSRSGLEMQAQAAEYNLIRHSDGREIGKGIITPVQLARYLEMVQMPQCTLRLGDLPTAFYRLKDQYINTHLDTKVFLE